jgi:DNA-binding response OmpR family regulator
MERSEVELVRWPADARRLAGLREAGRPRLLVIATGADPPPVTDPLEDWVREPPDPRDVRLRRATLAARAAGRDGQADERPDLDDDGVLRYRGRWVALPPVDARLVGALLHRYGAVVHRDVLAEACWPGRGADRSLLDTHVLRLRRRIGPLGLAVRTVRMRGYLLQDATRPHDE